MSSRFDILVKLPLAFLTELFGLFLVVLDDHYRFVLVFYQNGVEIQDGGLNNVMCRHITP